jgi:hypothetical protein
LLSEGKHKWIISWVMGPSPILAWRKPKEDTSPNTVRRNLNAPPKEFGTEV